MALKIIAIFVGFYAFAGLVGALQVSRYAHAGLARLLFALALLAGAAAGFPTAVWLWRGVKRAPAGLRLFGLAFLAVAILIPFQGHIDKPWSAVLAEVLGSTGWAVFIFYLARYVARKVGAPAA